MTTFSTVVAFYPEAKLAERAVGELCKSGINPKDLSIATVEGNLSELSGDGTDSEESRSTAYLVVVDFSSRQASFAKDLLQGMHKTFHTVHGERVMEHGS